MLISPVPEGVDCPHTACLGPRPSDLGGLTNVLAFSALVPFPCPASLTGPGSIVVRGGSVVKVGLAEREWVWDHIWLFGKPCNRQGLSVTAHAGGLGPVRPQLT